MGNTNNQIELLSPAGSPESLEAAVASGADAVYLGLDEFNARAKAVNFNRDNLKHYISFCHNHNVKVYLTLNILLYDDEIKRAYETACFARNCGSDALIIQDMGLFSILKKQMPDFPIYASTQMSINTPEGAAELESRGFSRVILAREMSETNIRAAVDTGIETEVFVHGARCYSYSGQCLMSSMLGGRSANRGMCAQTCRLPYTLSDDSGDILMKGHLLSLKDTMYLEEIHNLQNIGVKSLKIEGRMKGPEFVAVATSTYRKYLNNENFHDIAKEDIDNLYKAFNREGFSKGALSKNPGENEFASHNPSNSGFPVGKVIKGGILGSYTLFDEFVSKDDGLRIGSDGGYANRNIDAGTKAVVPIKGQSGDIVYRTRDNIFNKKYSYKNTMKHLVHIPISARAVIKKEQRPYMEVFDNNGNSAKSSLDVIVEKANMSGTPIERIEKQLLKSGATAFEITTLDLNCDENIYIKISHINELRRKVLEKLYFIRTGIPEPKECDFSKIIKRGKIESYPEYSLLLYNVPKNFDPSEFGVERIYLDAESCAGDITMVRNICKENDIEFYLHIPYSMDTPPKDECDGYLIENIGMLQVLHREKIVLGSGFNLTNSYAISEYTDVHGITLSHEMSSVNIESINNTSGVPLEATIYGNLRVMESPYCPARDICSGDLCSKNRLKLTDRKDEEWGVIYNIKQHSVRIFNPHKLLLFDKLSVFSSAGVKLLRLNITDETNEEIVNLLSYARGERFPHINPSHKYTSGRF